LPPRVLVAVAVYDEETSVRLQIFLDNHEFGPGKIDGKMGEFFGKALVSYKRAHGLATTGSVDAQFLDEVPVPYTSYTIRPDDEHFVGAVASKPSEQAKLKALVPIIMPFYRLFLDWSPPVSSLSRALSGSYSPRLSHSPPIPLIL